jgi:hypothetical protein
MRRHLSIQDVEEGAFCKENSEKLRGKYRLWCNGDEGEEREATRKESEATTSAAERVRQGVQRAAATPTRRLVGEHGRSHFVAVV